MSQKKTYEEVKKIIEEKGNCKLLSKEYINYDSKLTLKCKCGTIFKRSFQGLKRGDMLCNECKKKMVSEKFRKNFEDVKKYIHEQECEYISGEYINYSSKLILKCKCGNVFVKDFRHFKRGQNCCSSCGIQNLKKQKIKYTRDIAEEILSKRGITLIGDYVDGFHDIKCVCNKGHEFTTKLFYVLYNKMGCLKCSQEYHVGKNANAYKNGESEVLDRLRKITKPWKKEIAKKYNNVCYLTGSNKDCVVHHVIPFKKLVKEACEELNIPLYKKNKDYEPGVLKKLEQKVLEKHTLDMGILLQRKVHYKFHSLYGKDDNNLQQFLEFSENYIKNE